MPFVGEATLYVRFAETDMMGIVHHASYIVYLEEARSAYARQRGQPYSEFEKSGYSLAVTEVHMRYVKPAVYEQQITIRAWISEMKSRGLTFAYEVVDAASGDVLATATSKHVCITHSGQVARLPESWRAWGEN